MKRDWGMHDVTEEGEQVWMPLGGGIAVMETAEFDGDDDFDDFDEDDFDDDGLSDNESEIDEDFEDDESEEEPAEEEEEED